MALKKAEKAEIKKNNTGPVKPAMTDEQIRIAESEMVRRYASQLSEHFDSVQIICTKVTPDDETYRYTYGHGDIYARMKATQFFLQQAHEHYGQ